MRIALTGAGNAFAFFRGVLINGEGSNMNDPRILGYGEINLPSGNSNPVLNFVNAFATIPSVVLICFETPTTNSDLVDGDIIRGSITATQFQLSLNAPPTDALKYVFYLALK